MWKGDILSFGWMGKKVNNCVDFSKLKKSCGAVGVWKHGIFRCCILMFDCFIWQNHLLCNVVINWGSRSCGRLVTWCFQGKTWDLVWVIFLPFIIFLCCSSGPSRILTAHPWTCSQQFQPTPTASSPGPVESSTPSPGARPFLLRR